MIRKIGTLLVLTALAGLSLAKPNFTGQWKIDSAKSDFGQFPAPEKFERKIAHSDPNLETNTTQSGRQGEITTALKYTTDGKECTNTIRGSEVKGTARWEGEVLVIESTRSTPNGDLKIIERWSSINEGKSLLVDMKVSGGFGDVAVKVHLDRQ